MLRSGDNLVDPINFDRTVTKHIRLLCNILIFPVKGPYEQVPQIAVKCLRKFYACAPAQCRGDAIFSSAPQQYPTQLAWQQDNADLARKINF